MRMASPAESVASSAESAVTMDDDIDRQKSEWLYMKERMNQLVQNADVSNVESVAGQIMSEDIIKGRGLFCQAILASQSKSPRLSGVYAALVATINSRFPDVGYLLVKRATLQFKAAFDSNHKRRMQTASAFLAQLVNRRVACENLAVTVLMYLFVERTSDYMEIAVGFCHQCGSLLLQTALSDLKEFLVEFRRLLRRRAVNTRVQEMIVRLFTAARRWKDDELLEVDEDQVIHDVCLLQDLDYESSLDRFHQEDDDEASSRPPS